MKQLNTPSQDLSEARISSLHGLLTSKFGENWCDLENETISLELGLQLSPLLLDKLDVLRVLILKPELFYEDFLFFAHAVTVINNHVADFDHLPMPTSLEMAYGIHEVAKIAPGVFPDPMKEGISYILRQEGFSDAPPPLDVASFHSRLVEGQEIEDRQAKYSAVEQYINHMESLQ